MSNFLLLIVMDGEEYNISFINKTDYESSLIADLKSFFMCYEKAKTEVIEKNEQGNLMLTLNKDFQIKDASH